MPKEYLAMKTICYFDPICAYWRSWVYSVTKTTFTIKNGRGMNILRVGNIDAIFTWDKDGIRLRGQKSTKSKDASASRQQSTTLIDPSISYLPKPFMSRVGKNWVTGPIMAITEENTKRIVKCDFGSIIRPYRGNKENYSIFRPDSFESINALLQHVHQLAPLQPQNEHNETMVRLKWADGDNIAFFIDNLQSRLVAQLRAKDLANRLKQQQIENGIENPQEVSVPICSYIIPPGEKAYKLNRENAYPDARRLNDIEEGLKNRNKKIRGLALFLKLDELGFEYEEFKNFYANKFPRKNKSFTSYLVENIEELLVIAGGLTYETSEQFLIKFVTPALQELIANKSMWSLQKNKKLRKLFTLATACVSPENFKLLIEEKFTEQTKNYTLYESHFKQILYKSVYELTTPAENSSTREIFLNALKQGKLDVNFWMGTNNLSPYILHVIYTWSDEDPKIKNIFLKNKLLILYALKGAIDKQKWDDVDKILPLIETSINTCITEYISAYHSIIASLLEHNKIEYVMLLLSKILNNEGCSVFVRGKQKEIVRKLLSQAISFAISNDDIQLETFKELCQPIKYTFECAKPATKHKSAEPVIDPIDYYLTSNGPFINKYFFFIFFKNVEYPQSAIDTFLAIYETSGTTIPDKIKRKIATLASTLSINISTKLAPLDTFNELFKIIKDNAKTPQDSQLLGVEKIKERLEKIAQKYGIDNPEILTNIKPNENAPTLLTYIVQQKEVSADNTIFIYLVKTAKEHGCLDTPQRFERPLLSYLLRYGSIIIVLYSALCIALMIISMLSFNPIGLLISVLLYSPVCFIQAIATTFNLPFLRKRTTIFHALQVYRYKISFTCKTPLHLALETKQFEKAVALINAGANLNRDINKHYITNLFLYVVNNQDANYLKELLVKLRNLKFDVDINTKIRGKTGLEQAIEQNNFDKVNLIISHDILKIKLETKKIPVNTSIEIITLLNKAKQIQIYLKNLSKNTAQKTQFEQGMQYIEQNGILAYYESQDIKPKQHNNTAKIIMAIASTTSQEITDKITDQPILNNPAEKQEASKSPTIELLESFPSGLPIDCANWIRC